LLPVLFRFDQLNKERIAGTVLPGFLEGKINFIPTYKFERGNRQYTDEKLRIPSWCDRILYKSLPDAELKHLIYDSNLTITTSDHCPVFGVFEAPVTPWFIEPSTDVQGIKIELSNIILHGITTVQTSEGYYSHNFWPYITFKPSWWKKKYDQQEFFVITDEPISNDLTKIDFSDNNITQIYPFNAHIEILCNHYLWIVVRDRNLLGHYDVIGQGVISLMEPCKKMGETIDITAELSHRGLRAGVLKAQITLTLIDTIPLDNIPISEEIIYIKEVSDDV